VLYDCLLEADFQIPLDITDNEQTAQYGDFDKFSGQLKVIVNTKY